MATYIIGDVQGCFKTLMQLLKKIEFKPQKDFLWFAGDLINRGENSLASLRFIYEHRRRCATVLGNHDLHLLSTYMLKAGLRAEDTFNDILFAPDAGRLIHWLLEQPMCHYFNEHQLFLSHAGLYPGWSVSQALEMGTEIQHTLQHQADLPCFFSQMYGKTPYRWDPTLTGADRKRFIINTFTRMRCLSKDLSLDFSHKGGLENIPQGIYPWFNHPVPLRGEANIAFGHWASLKGVVGEHTNNPSSILALDTGCVWGGQLTAYCLEEQTLCHVSAI